MLKTISLRANRWLTGVLRWIVDSTTEAPRTSISVAEARAAAAAAADDDDDDDDGGWCYALVAAPMAEGCDVVGHDQFLDHWTPCDDCSTLP